MTAAKVYPGVPQLLGSSFAWAGATVKCALLTQSYSSVVGTQTYYSELSSYEVVGAGYTAGGVTLAGKAITLTNSTAAYTATNPSWAGLTATLRYAVFYISTGTPSTSQLLSYMDAEVALSPNSQLFTVILPPSGVLTVQGA